MSKVSVTPNEVDLEVCNPIRRGSDAWYLVESQSWDCYTRPDCGDCDACFWQEQRRLLNEVNADWLTSITRLVEQYRDTCEILRMT